MSPEHRGDASGRQQHHGCARPPRRSASGCPPCWSRPSGSPPPSRPACMAGGAPAWARPSGSSASTRPATPPSSIDWRQSARSRHLFVREQEWEAAESVWLWCDLSASMAFRSGPSLPLKWERAALLTLALAGAAGARRRARGAAGRRRAAGDRALRHGDADPLPGSARPTERGSAGAAAAAAAPRPARAALGLPAAARPAAPSASASSAAWARAPA